MQPKKTNVYPKEFYLLVVINGDFQSGEQIGHGYLTQYLCFVFCGAYTLCETDLAELRI